jgi:integrase
MFLSEAELHPLLEHLSTATQDAGGPSARTAWLDRIIIESLLFSGLRTSEFCRLRLGEALLEPNAPRFHVRGGPGDARTVHIPAALVRLLERFTHEHRPGLLPNGVRPDDPSQPLIFHERRRPYERTGLYRRVKRVLSQAGLGGRASIQLLRHTYGYLAYQRTGGNLLFVQRQLGHAHPMITSVYARLVDEDYAAMATRVAKPRIRLHLQETTE